MNDEPGTGATYDDLLEHLKDLSELAMNEGYPMLGAALAVTLEKLTDERQLFGARDTAAIVAAVESYVARTGKHVPLPVIPPV